MKKGRDKNKSLTFCPRRTDEILQPIPVVRHLYGKMTLNVPTLISTSYDGEKYWMIISGFKLTINRVAYLALGCSTFQRPCPWTHWGRE